MSEFDFFVSSLNDDVAHATVVVIVGQRALVCLSVVLVVLFAECGPFCALQACCKGFQVETVRSEIDFFASSTGNITLDHMKQLKNNTFVGNTGHFDNEIGSPEFLEGLEDGIITPLALQMMHLKGGFRTFPRFQKSAESGRQCGDDPAGGNFYAGRSSNDPCRSRRAC